MSSGQNVLTLDMELLILGHDQEHGTRDDGDLLPALYIHQEMFLFYHLPLFLVVVGNLALKVGSFCNMQKTNKQTNKTQGATKS